MDASLTALSGAAVSVAVLHTLIGVDHYLPFVVLGRARGWGLKKVAAITALCGVGHVIGSIALGFVGIGMGVALGELEWIESLRGSAAAWGLIAFGLVYMAWAGVRLLRDKRHAHPHAHHDGTLHHHDHDHHKEHLHAHVAKGASLTVWSVFILFVLGPCEPLIPLLMAPAWQHDWPAVAWVAGLFGVSTIALMTTLAVVGAAGLRMPVFKRAERYVNVLAGAAICLSGLAIQLLGI